ncbi:ABC transporter permease [Bosea sp. (in: a-proteobacteria)]|uniref:ABC transporter permease n=1 Tax=Bosea sp. (in: a-proteobacteria) TaxID=1871050 RepID=UPI0026052343|nr:ABC transporter permease [Bosea sp. (in: a-proteobacteria)]MCO5093134.1 ABC transporter permease [Bosea sp. (in: a-proteobacteria)]
MNRVFSTVLSRLLNSLVVLLLLSVLVFAFMRAIPGDPVVTMMGGESISKEAIARLHEEMGFNRPYYVQYLSWLGNVIQGDFGQSLQSRDPVLPILLDRLKATAELAILATLLGSVFGVVAGTIAAIRKGSWFDSATMFLTLSGISLPVFWFGMILIVVFSVYFNIFPTGGMVSYSTVLTRVTGFTFLDSILTLNREAFVDVASHMVLPAVTLATAPAALIARTTRASVLEVINEDYVNAGLARGLSFPMVVARHVMRNAMIPVVTIIGLEIGVYLGGSIVTETLFSWPGLGRHMMQAILANDYPVVQGAIIIYAVIIVFVNLMVDVSYGFIDPRVRQ